MPLKAFRFTTSTNHLFSIAPTPAACIMAEKTDGQGPIDRRQFGKTIATTTVASPILTSAAAGACAAVLADRILIEIGYDWISPNQLILPYKPSIAHVRTRLWDKYGLHLPFCSIRDDLSLDPYAFRASFNGRMQRFGHKQPRALAFLNQDWYTRIAFAAEDSVDDFRFHLTNTKSQK